jgi:hypothetical protein
MNPTNAEPSRFEQRISLDSRENRVLLLSLAYLRAGLTSEDALESALADLESAGLEEE